MKAKPCVNNFSTDVCHTDVSKAISYDADIVVPDLARSLRSECFRSREVLRTLAKHAECC